ncbi:hypothetical protein Noda2021_05070 [Candidatus Dependentiae bacterium Noda2021]|nr:hypothetical protein Noda2021_05070 [Candidatus Dependentiae bacterium Noda2021]
MKSIFLSLLLSIVSLNCCATIVSGKELFSPELNQTVLLFGDCHWLAPQVDTQQISQVVKSLKQFKPLMLFEGFQEKETSSLFLDNIYSECLNNNLENKGIEFRAVGGSFRHFNFEIMKNSTYPQLKELFTKKETQRKVFFLFTESLKECHAKQDQLYQKLDKIFETNPTHPLALNAEKYFFDLVKKRDELLATLPAEQKKPDEEAASIAHFIFNDFFVPDAKGQQFLLNKQSVVHKLEELGDNLLELDAFFEIIHHSNKPLISIFTGQKHTSALSKLLKMNTFVKKHSSISQKAQINKATEELSKTKSFKEILSAPELHQFALDIKAFLQKCSFNAKK